MLHLLIFFLLQTKVNCDYVYGDKSLRFDVFENFINYNFNPDEYLNVPQIIRRHGYPVETHLVETSDGYLLGLHRIPRAKNGTKGRQPVLLQHGLFGSSADWILNGNNSLGFILADQGYDVWLGNDRGNTYSKAHVSLPPWSEQYWNFSWHEMGINDLPAVIYYISNVTGLIYQISKLSSNLTTTWSSSNSGSITSAKEQLSNFVNVMLRNKSSFHIRSESKIGFGLNKKEPQGEGGFLNQDFSFSNDLSSASTSTPERKLNSNISLKDRINFNTLASSEASMDKENVDPCQKTGNCKFCFKNGEPAAVYKSHITKNVHGTPICPILRKFVCELCGATGDKAHTRKYCPLSRKMETVRPAFRRLSNGVVVSFHNHK